MGVKDSPNLLIPFCTALNFYETVGFKKATYGEVSRTVAKGVVIHINAFVDDSDVAARLLPTCARISSYFRGIYAAAPGFQTD